jgi:Zn-dependent peptidase ImmA (M78 family)
MTANDLASKVGVTRQSISKYELGVTEPSGPILAALSEQLEVPVSFFYKPLSAPENRGTTFYRSLKTNAARAKDVMSSKSHWATQIAALLSKDIVFPDVDIPPLPEKYSQNQEFSFDEIEDIALYVRRTWGLGITPIQNMSRLLESHGIIIATIKTGFMETDACSSFIDTRPYIFLDTQKECAVRTRFNMAHELGHLILHGNITQSDIEDKKILNRIEKEANQFASSFLLPRDSFLLDIRSTSLQSFLPLKKKWKTSIQAMVYRCQELDVFSDNQMIYLQKQISAKRWRKTEPFDNEWPSEDTYILCTAVKMLLERGYYTKDSLLSTLRFPAKDIEELCSLPKGTLSTQEPSNPVVIQFSTKNRT